MVTDKAEIALAHRAARPRFRAFGSRLVHSRALASAVCTKTIGRCVGGNSVVGKTIAILSINPTCYRQRPRWWLVPPEPLEPSFGQRSVPSSRPPRFCFQVHD